MQQRIFLVGPMGAGKTTIGKKLASSLQLTFLDSDQLLTAQLQVSMRDIISQHGEAYFRTQEQQILAKFSLQPNIVFATGGGCILAAQSRGYLQERGIVCYLKVSPELQMQRLHADQTRALLPTGNERLPFLQQMFVTRDPLYASIANLILDTDSQDIDAVTTTLITKLKQYVCTK